LGCQRKFDKKLLFSGKYHRQGPVLRNEEPRSKFEASTETMFPMLAGIFVGEEIADHKVWILCGFNTRTSQYFTD
jgi:hypothetical protein